MLVALGANLPSELGEPFETVSHAIEVLVEGFQDAQASRLYKSAAFPAGSGPDFINAAVRFVSDQSPGTILKHLHEVEARMGRKRGVRWAARVMDLDLLSVGSAVLPNRETHAEWRSLSLEEQMKRAPDGLILPHPRLQDRAFVLKPMADISPDWVHPVIGKSVAQMLDDLPQDLCDEVMPV